MRVLLRLVAFVVLVGAAATLAPKALAQSSQNFPSQNTGRMPASPLGGQTDDNAPGNRDPLAVQQEIRRQRAAMDERQRKMQEDTAKLLQLAEQLKAEMEKSNKFQMSLDVIRKAEEIEKLARDVKNRMKG